MRPALAGLPRYIATVETAKHHVFQFLDGDILPDNKLIAIGSDDAFHLGVLSSAIHVEWALRAGGWLGVGNDSVYVKSRGLRPLPLPRSDPRSARHDRRAGRGARRDAVDRDRRGAAADDDRTLQSACQLADGSATPAEHARAVAARAGIVARLHDQIDAAVAAAYGWEWPMSPTRIVAQLVTLNAERAAEESAGRVRWLRPDHQAHGQAVPRETA